MTIRQFLARLETVFPPWFALAQDPIGLQIGNDQQPLKKVFTTIDVIPEAVMRARQMGANLILSIHAPLFCPPTSVTSHTRSGDIITQVLKNHMAVYVLHTILDVIPGGTSDLLAKRLDLQNCHPLQTTKIVPDCKLVVFVPKSHTEKVRQAICTAGAGMIGKYDQCSFRLEGTGTYRPLSEAKPFKGKIGTIEQAEECRLEVEVPEHQLNAVMQALRQSHPYEEIAYDLYQKVDGGTIYGIGRVGTLKQALPWARLLKTIANRITPVTSVTKPKQNMVRKVAVLAGSGKSYIAAAANHEADVFVTGELDHHTRLEARWRGLGIVELGHAESELIALPFLGQISHRLCYGLAVNSS